MVIDQKVIVVTGAGSGMGRELTMQLVQKGAKVAMVDINEKGLSETADIVGSQNVSSHIVNIADRAAVELLPEAVIAHHGQVDAIINNAGIIQPFINVSELQYDVIERIMNINFYGTLYMTKSFLPHLLRRPTAHIANISSMGGFIPFPGQTFYGASKAAVKLLTEGLYTELMNTKVGVTIVHPGAINTNIMSNSGVQTKEEEAKQKAQAAENQTTSAPKAASIIIAAIEKNKYRVMVGKDAKMLDIFYRFAPQKAVNFITKQMGKMRK